MRPKNRLVAQEQRYYRPEIQDCPQCQTKLTYCHTVSNKLVATLQGVFRIVNMGYRCPNPDCSSRTVFRSAEAERFSMKYTTYGMDIIAWVGRLRFRDHKTCSEIGEILREHGVPTSDRNVQMLYERYTLLLQASATSHAKEALKPVIEEHGGIILSIDGVQPEKGNETLYILREVLSGTILAAKNVKSSATQHLIDFIRPILDLGFPLLGVISDGQLSIRKAFEHLVPDIPYQYCQYHYLKDIAKPVVDQDRQLKTAIKKNLRGVRDVERRAASQESLESEIAEDYAAAIRSVLLEDGKEPLDLPGQKVYEQTRAIQQSLAKCLDQKGGRATSKTVQYCKRSGEFF